jgi:phytanoyl-CoA hydroxylase
MLNNDQIESFKRNGYLIIEDYIDSTKRQQLMSRAEELIAEFDHQSHRSVFTTKEQQRTSDDNFIGSADKVRFFFEQEAFDKEGKLTVPKRLSINKIGHAQHLLDPVYKVVVDGLQLSGIAKQLGVVSPRAIQSMHIFKQPRIGGEVDLHQDSTFIYTEPMSCIGFWLALEDATIDNGCLQALPGGHKIALKRRFYKSKQGDMRFEELDDSEWPDDELAVLEVDAGTMIILHGQLPHYSAANVSEKSRQAFTMHVVDGDCYYPKDNWLQTDLV